MNLLLKYPVLIKLIPATLFIWTVMILYLTLLPSDSLPSARIFSYDKLGHFGMFGGWTGLLGLYFLYVKKDYSVSLPAITTAGIVFGIVIELLQLTLPINRLFSFYDILANTAGCITAYIILAYLKEKLITARV